MSENIKRDFQNRADLLIIADIISKGASVLDLGCGDGALIQYLKAEKNVYACGVEIEQSKILECVKKDVPVLHGDLNNGLSEFPDKSFDVVVLSQTLQAVARPDKLIEEMMRVGHKGLVSFINFGYFNTRMQLLVKGTMPVTEQLPDNWYDTPNIHLATIADFRNLCRSRNITIIKEIPFGGHFGILSSLWKNLFAPMCVFEMESE
jgi:methionine biosynthesis protein MetW